MAIASALRLVDFHPNGFDCRRSWPLSMPCEFWAASFIAATASVFAAGLRCAAKYGHAVGQIMVGELESKFHDYNCYDTFTLMFFYSGGYLYIKIVKILMNIFNLVHILYTSFAYSAFWESLLFIKSHLLSRLKAGGKAAKERWHLPAPFINGVSEFCRRG